MYYWSVLIILSNVSKSILSQLIYDIQDDICKRGISEEMFQALVDKLRVITDENRELRKKVENHESRIMKELKNQESGITKELDKRESGIRRETENQTSQIWKKLENQESSFLEIQTKINDLSMRVAFTAGLTSNSNSWSNGTLVFDKVFNNVGGGYDPSTGIFIAPVAGDYVFYVSIQSYGSQSIEVVIVLNGSYKVLAKAYASPNETYETGTNMVILRLQKGDMVWVRHIFYSGYNSYSPAPITTFSGFLI